jgi:dipeptidase E
MSAPLPTTWEHPVPVEEILDFPVPATASHLESLEDHVDTNFIVADDIAQAISEPVVNNDQKNVSDAPPAVPQIKIVASGNERGMRLQPIVDKVVELSGVDLPKVLYVGTASFDRTDKFLRQTKAFREMGCEIRRLDVSEKDTVPSIDEMKELVVEWAEVIMCSGGNTLHALLRWKEVGLDLLMKEASLKGVVLCGGSAGAGCWFSSLHTDSLRPDNTKNKEHVKSELSEEELADWDYTKISALGFVDAMCVPHFDKTGTNGVERVEDAERLLQESPSTPAIGVDENAALVIVGNEALAVSGDGKVSVSCDNLLHFIS